MGVPAAHLHELVVPPRLYQRKDLHRERASKVRVAKLLDELHRSSIAIAVPAWTSSRSPLETGSTRAVSTACRSPLSSAHNASPRCSSILATVIATPSSPQVMQ